MPRPPDNNPLVLIVDDAEDNRDVYGQFLRHHGWRVEVARDGVEALRKVDTLSPSVIVLDLSLPRLDGWEVTRRLKSNPATRRIPVVVLTAHALDESKRTALEAGVDDYLVKPCLPMELVARVKRHLR